MIILHQEMRAKPDKCDEVMAALAAIIPGARNPEGVIKLDIARDLLDPDSSSRPGSTRTVPLLNDRSRLQRCTGPSRCLPTRWPLRPIGGSTTGHATNPRLIRPPPTTCSTWTA